MNTTHCYLLLRPHRCPQSLCVCDVCVCVCEGALNTAQCCLLQRRRLIPNRCPESLYVCVCVCVCVFACVVCTCVHVRVDATPRAQPSSILDQSRYPLCAKTESNRARVCILSQGYVMLYFNSIFCLSVCLSVCLSLSVFFFVSLSWGSSVL